MAALHPGVSIFCGPGHTACYFGAQRGVLGFCFRYYARLALHHFRSSVLTLTIPLRKIFNFKAFITIDVLENVAKTIVFTGLIVGFAYITEFFIAWYSHNIIEIESFRWRATGDYRFEFLIMVICNTMIPLLFLFKKVRTKIGLLLGISLFVNLGMWYERFVIIIGGVAHGFSPHSWDLYRPTGIEYGILMGSFCMFFFLFLLFAKHLPSVSMTEMKETLEKGTGHAA